MHTVHASDAELLLTCAKPTVSMCLCAWALTQAQERELGSFIHWRISLFPLDGSDLIPACVSLKNAPKITCSSPVHINEAFMYHKMGVTPLDMAGLGVLCRQVCFLRVHMCLCHVTQFHVECEMTAGTIWFFVQFWSHALMLDLYFVGENLASCIFNIRK